MYQAVYVRIHYLSALPVLMLHSNIYTWDIKSLFIKVWYGIVSYFHHLEHCIIIVFVRKYVIQALKRENLYFSVLNLYVRGEPGKSVKGNERMRWILPGKRSGGVCCEALNKPFCMAALDSRSQRLESLYKRLCLYQDNLNLNFTLIANSMSEITNNLWDIEINI